MSIRKTLYFKLVSLRNQKLGKYYDSYIEEDRKGISPYTKEKGLINILDHCRNYVPFYKDIINKINKSYYDDPFEYLKEFPVLTKDLIRNNFDNLKSLDLSSRNWHINTSGGSTGNPIQIIQDSEYNARSGAIKLFYSKLVGREIGQLEVLLWGSMRDFSHSRNWKAFLVQLLENKVILNAFRMTPQKMKYFIDYINKRKPKLIVAYVTSLYELSKFAEQEKLIISSPCAVITSAGVLYPYMRETIERVFQTKIFNRYGSREVGDIACERPGTMGLWVAPWGNYVEIIDEDGNTVSDGEEGEILITSLSNFAMPLIRYKIGDRGYISNKTQRENDSSAQILGNVTGRSIDAFRLKDGTIVNPSYFNQILFFRSWIHKYQIVQKDYSHIIFNIVKSDKAFDQNELEEIRNKTQLIIGSDCKVDFLFVDEIPESVSGKYRFLISEIQSG